MKLEAFLKKLKEFGYNRYVSTKIKISKADLADSDKVKLILKKAKNYMGWLKTGAEILMNVIAPEPQKMGKVKKVEYKMSVRWPCSPA